MKNSITIKSPIELQELVKSAQNKDENSEKEMYMYFDLIHNALMNYQSLIDGFIYSINEHNQNVKRNS